MFKPETQKILKNEHIMRITVHYGPVKSISQRSVATQYGPESI